LLSGRCAAAVKQFFTRGLDEIEECHGVPFSFRLEILAYTSGKKFLSERCSRRKGPVNRAMQESDHSSTRSGSFGGPALEARSGIPI
jgi:hypothetical protein